MSEHKDTKIQKYWRPAGAGVYFILVLFDNVIRPIMNNKLGKDFELAQAVSAIEKLDSSIQIKALELAAQSGTIPPILTDSVHYTFAAILGAAAWTRGKEKIERLKGDNG